jgi:DNA-directed RNA polymerase specialized sigma24 family protein
MTRYNQVGGKTRHWSFDPAQVDSIPEILKHLTVEDEYFADDDPMTVLAHVLDQILAALPNDLAEPVRLVYLTGLSYRAAGQTLGIDHKTVKKRADAGIVELRRRLTDTAWIAALLEGQLPEQSEQPRLSSDENIVSVLSTLNRKAKETSDDTEES